MILIIDSNSVICTLRKKIINKDRIHFNGFISCLQITANLLKNLTNLQESPINLKYTTSLGALIPSFSWVSYLDRNTLKTMYCFVGVEVVCWKNTWAVAYLCSYFFFPPQGFIASMWLFQRITKSQNCHGWKGCCQVTCTSTLLEQGCLESVVQEPAQMAFGHMQGWQHRNFPWQPVISQYHSKKPFLVFKGNLQNFSLKAIVSGCSPPKGAWLASLHLYSRNLYSNTVTFSSPD